MVGLGDLPGGAFSSMAFGVSGDGTRIVGQGRQAVPGPAGQTARAVIWDSEHGLREIKGVLENDYGLDLTGWTLVEANAISRDGTTIVGTGYPPEDAGSPNRILEAWLARIPAAALPGDIDGDGDVDEADQALFIQVLLGIDTGDPAHVTRSDLDGSGTADGLDIQLFVNARLAP
jgi:hypothetical protein